MSTSQRPPAESATSAKAPRPGAEPPYEPPAVVWEESLEIATPSSCAKFAPQGGACAAASKS